MPTVSELFIGQQDSSNRVSRVIHELRFLIPVHLSFCRSPAQTRAQSITLLLIHTLAHLKVNLH